MLLKHRFTDRLKAHCARKIAEGAQFSDIYRQVTAANFKDDRYTGSYAQFTRQLKKLTPEFIDGYKFEDFTDPRKQIEYLSKLISNNVGTAADRVRALELIGRLQERIEAETEPQLGHKLVDVTPEFAVEIIGIAENRLQLIENLLQVLIAEERRGLFAKFLPDVIVVAHNKETIQEKINRLREELSKLTKEELSIVEHENESLERDN